MVAKESKQEGSRYLFADWYGNEEKKWYGEVWEFGHAPVYCHNEVKTSASTRCSDQIKMEKIMV